MAEKITKVTIVGEDSKEWKERRIKFFKALDTEHDLIDCKDDPAEYDYVELICLDYDRNGSDLLFAYNKDEGRSGGTLYIGKFNYGMV